MTSVDDGGIRVRTRAFWALFLAYMCTPLAVFTVITHRVAVPVDHGFPRLFVANVFGLTGFGSIAGRVLCPDEGRARRSPPPIPPPTIAKSMWPISVPGWAERSVRGWDR